jgi:D-alanyl-D-alanine carboxypeptidase
MTEQRAWPRTTRAVLAALALLAAFLTPQVGAVPASAAPDDDVLRSELQADVDAHLQARGVPEHISAVALSVSLPDGGSRIDVSAGSLTLGGTEPVGPDSVWQIGSNTKAFTSVLLLQYEAEGRLSIDDPLATWLPQYQQWADVTIRRLLNMTSGVPDYDERPAFWTDYAADPLTDFTPERLVGYVVGVPGTSGYRYSNTNYVLAEMIVEQVTGNSYRDELEERLLEPLCLRDTWYRPHVYPDSVTDREPAGYFAADFPPEMSALVGRDVSRDTLSWARGAGGMIATTGDMTRWERALYRGDLLPAEQEAELTSLVSTATGQPIEQTSLADPEGYGLGVSQLTVEPLGTVWAYGGGMLGFRTLHVYLPASGVIMAMGLNSSTANNQTVALVQSVYETLAGHGLVPAVPAPVDAAA